MDTEMNIPRMEEVDYFAALLLKQLRQEITEAELQSLENWKAAHPSHAQVCEEVNDGDRLLTDLLAMKQVDMEGWWQKISEQVQTEKKAAPFYQRWYTYAAAAVVLIIAGAITWQYWKPAKLPKAVSETHAPVVMDVMPGGNKASLILSNGSIIDLTGRTNGKVAQEGNVIVVKTNDGELTYKENSGSIESGTIWNTLQTPRGGQYHVVLPDGSKAWLNAASSIKYPTRFSGTERHVAISGEVYFEVASLPTTRDGKRKPFIVTVQSAIGRELAGVEVKGTSFDIMAYDDEAAIKTSLLTGKLSVSMSGSTAGNSNHTKLLIPGQQAQIPKPAANAAVSGTIKVVNMTNVDDVTGWKEGLLPLKGTDLKEIMRIVARWYNIEVEYQGNIPAYSFNGTLLLKQNLSLVLQFLEYEGVHFKVQQNKLIVIP